MDPILLPMVFPVLGRLQPTFYMHSRFQQFHHPGWTHAGYSAYVDDLVPHPFGAAVANLPGRIIINATI